MPGSKPTKAERVAFGKRLKAARVAAGYTQAQVALACGMSDNNVVSKWETGVNSPSEHAPWVLCELLGYDAWSRLWGTEPEAAVVVRAGTINLLTATAPDARVAEAARIMRSLSDELAQNGLSR